MITRRQFQHLLPALLLPCPLLAADKTYDAKALVDLIPKPPDLGADWHPVHPDRWLVVAPLKVAAFYDYKPPQDSGHTLDSVIANILILASATEADKMLTALKNKAVSIPGNVLEEAPQLSTGAFVSHYGPEARYGRRVTFCEANLLISLPPSHNGMTVATKIWGALRKP